MATQSAPSAQPAHPATGLASDRTAGLESPGSSGQSWWGRYKLPYLYILPAAIVLGVVTLYPIGFQLWMSLTDYNRRNLRGRPADFVGLDNFKRILTNDLGLDYYNFWRILGFNSVWMVVNVFLHVAIGVAVALLLNRRDVICKRFFR